MKTVKLLAFCLLSSLVFSSCGSDKKDDPQPAVVETDFRDAYIGLYKGNVTINYMKYNKTGSSQHEDQAVIMFKVTKNPNKKNYIDISVYSEGEFPYFFSVKLTSTSGEGTSSQASSGIIENQYSDFAESEIYGIGETTHAAITKTVLWCSFGYVDEGGTLSDGDMYSIKYKFYGERE